MPRRALTEAEGDFDKAVEVLRVSGPGQGGEAGRRALCDERAGGLRRRRPAAARRRDRLRGEERRVPAPCRRRGPGCRRQPRPTRSRRPKRPHCRRARRSPRRSSELAVKIGEKLEVSAAAYFDGQTAVYLHRACVRPAPAGGRVWSSTRATTRLRPGRPRCRSRRCVRSTSAATRFRPIWWRTSAGSPKPRPGKRGSRSRPYRRSSRAGSTAFFKDVVLLDQPSVTDNKTPVGRLLTGRRGDQSSGSSRFEARAA